MSTGRVGFTISHAAKAIIRDGGEELWIWPGDEGRPYTSSRPPRIYGTSWTTYRPDGLSIHVDSRIVPPWRWRLAAADGEQGVAAHWDGLDPRVFDREPLEEPPEDPPKPTSSPLAHVSPYLVIPVLTWALAIVWTLRFVGVHDGWLSIGQAFLGAALWAGAAVTAFIAWSREKRKKLARWRADKALDAEVARSPLPLRPLGEDSPRGSELA